GAGTTGTGLTIYGGATTTSDLLALGSTTVQSLASIHATSSNNVTALGNLRFDGEILPDGLTCANGDILKKTGANDWDCTVDATGAGGGISWPFTKLATNEQATTTTLGFYNGFISSGSSTAPLLRGDMWAIGTTTARWALQVSTTSAPNLVLSDSGSLTSNHFAFRNSNGMLYIATSSPTSYATSSTAVFTIDGTTGKVGISSTSPMAVLTVAGSNTNLLKLDDGSGANILTVDSTISAANSGIDITAGGSQTGNLLQFFSSGGTLLSFVTTAGGFQQNISSSTAVRVQNGSATDVFVIDSTASRVGVATSTPWRTFSVTGTVGFDGLTASTTIGNSLCLSNAKEVTLAVGRNCATASSLRFKENIAALTSISGLSEVMALNPVSFFYKPNYLGAFADEPNWNGERVGFIAEEIQLIDPRLVTIDEQGNAETVRYELITPILAKAIQELNLNIQGIASTSSTSTPESQTFASNFFSNMFNRISTWLADAANGIGDIFANRVRTKELCVRDDAGAETCLTKAQLDALILGAVSGNSGSVPAIVETPPSVEQGTGTSTPAEPAPQEAATSTPATPPPDPVIIETSPAPTPDPAPAPDPSTASADPAGATTP
ncbi:MAG: tail fiber domain-containing protein, partial [Patescibacteria group bacterium]